MGVPAASTSTTSAARSRHGGKAHRPGTRSCFPLRRPIRRSSLSGQTPIGGLDSARTAPARAWRTDVVRCAHGTATFLIAVALLGGAAACGEDEGVVTGVSATSVVGPDGESTSTASTIEADAPGERLRDAQILEITA